MAPPINVSLGEWDIVRETLQSHVPDTEVWAFGSRANGVAKPYSDLDLALLGEAAVTLPRLAELAEVFEQSDLRFRVDLIDLLTVDPVFRERVTRSGVRIQTREQT